MARLGAGRGRGRSAAARLRGGARRGTARGRFADAVASFEEALCRFRESGDRYEEASTLENLGAAQIDAGDVTAAATAWRRAATILDDLVHPAAAKLRDRLANLPQPTTPRY